MFVVIISIFCIGRNCSRTVGGSTCLWGPYVLVGIELVEVVYFALVAHDGLVVFVNGGVKVGEGLL